jgi:uncharacterized membrane protein
MSTMEASTIYVVIALVALAIIFVLFFIPREKRKSQLTPLAGLAFGFILAGIFANESRVVGYGLMGIGVILAIADIIVKAKKKQ